MDFFHDGMRELQDRYEGRAVADRLEAHRMHRSFTEDDRQMIETAAFFLLATASESSVDCSFKGGAPGFVTVTGAREIAWPDYDGNRMYRSLGNILRNPRVGLLFIRLDGARFDGSAARMRINGRARIDESAAAIAGTPGAKRLIRVEADHIFPNCPRYIPRMEAAEASPFLPEEGRVAPDPEWKSMPMVKDIFDAEG